MFSAKTYRNVEIQGTEKTKLNNDMTINKNDKTKININYITTQISTKKQT